MCRGILIVDDNSSVRRSLRSLIQLTGNWNICGEAENGAVAIEKVRSLHPDMVILDLAMPVMNGLESAKEISKISPTTHIVLYTMHASDQLKVEAQTCGIHDVIPKTSEGCSELQRLLKNRLLSNQVEEKPGKTATRSRTNNSALPLQSSH